MRVNETYFRYRPEVGATTPTSGFGVETLLASTSDISETLEPPNSVGSEGLWANICGPFPRSARPSFRHKRAVENRDICPTNHSRLEVTNRSFYYSVHVLWNSLPEDLPQFADNYSPITSIISPVFYKKLEAHLFRWSFPP